MAHIVLLGDSVFDNSAYVNGGPDVVRQLRGILGAGQRATLAAVDGAVMANVRGQLRAAPADASHLVVSVGGNDALRHAAILDGPARSMGDALDRLSAVQAEFRENYASMLADVLERKLPTAVCTIYDPRFPDPAARRRGTVALAVLNDVITREAFARGVTLLDLRLICGADADFANPIEPSVEGGGKIAGAIAALVDASRPEPASRVIGR